MISSSPIIQVRKLRKSFESVVAVNDISFEIDQGTCFGLLGPNGAGKTTTVEMLEGILEPSGGEILYKGQPLSDQFRQQAGIMFQSTALQDYITVREALIMFGSFYDQCLPIEELIEKCSLADFLERDTRKLSGGQKQRLLLAIALINDPQVIFLDEPTTGLDPQARRNFWQLVDEIKSQNKTVILTTHYMDEANILCDELVFMDNGSIIASGSPSDLLASSFNDVILEIPISPAMENLPEQAFHELHLHESKVEIYTTDVNASIQLLLAHGVTLADLRIRSRTLEDLFIDLTGKDLRA